MAKEEVDNDGGLDAGQMFDEGVDKAGIAEEDPEVLQDTLAHLEDGDKSDAGGQADEGGGPDDDKGSAKAAEGKSSSMAAMLDEQQPEAEVSDETKAEQGKDGRVPLDQHIKLRQRAQKAESEAQQLREQLTKTQSAGDNAEFDKLLSGLADDELVEASKVKQLLTHQRTNIISEVNNRFEKLEQGFETAAQMSRIQQKVRQSESAFKKEHEDFDAVLVQAKMLNLVGAKEFKAALNADNPAKTYYETCKNKLATARRALGIETPQDKKEQADKATGNKRKQPDETGNEEENEEEVFKAVFGSEEPG